MLGAIGEKDIGHHFPNSDETLRGISSIEILKRVKVILERQKSRAANVDATLIAEAPRIGPHVEAMKKKISDAIGLDQVRISIKATSNEGLGAIGRGEGMAAMAIATVEQD